MEVENIGIPVILQGLFLNGGEARRKSISDIPRELEPSVGGVRRNSISVIPQEIALNGSDIVRSSVPQEMELKGGDARGNSNLVIPQEPYSGDIRSWKVDLPDDIIRNSIPMIPEEIDPNDSDIGRDSVPEVPQEMESKGGDAGGNSSIVFPQETEPDGDDSRSSRKVDPPADIKRNSIPVIPLEMEPIGGDVRRNSTGVIPQEIERNGGSIRRNSVPAIPQKMEPKVDTRRNYLLVIPNEIQPGRVDVRRNIGVKIQSRYLKAQIGSCHDYCKYGLRNASEEKDTTSAERKKISTPSSKPCPDSEIWKLSIAKDKKVSSSKKRETVSSKKVLSPKEIGVCMEQLIDSNVKAKQLELSSLPGSFLSPGNSKVISTISPNPSPDSVAPNSIEGFIDLNAKAEPLGPSSLPGQSSSHHGRNGNNGNRKSKEVPECSSSRANTKIRSRTLKTSVPVDKKMLEPEAVSLTSKHLSNANTGSRKNRKGLSHLKDQNSRRDVEPEGPCNEDMPEKILYVKSNTEKGAVEPTPNGVHAPEVSSSSSSFEVKSLKQARKGIGTTRSAPSSEKKNLKRIVNRGHASSPSPLHPENKGLRHRTRTSLSSSSASSLLVSPAESVHNGENGATSQHNTMKTNTQSVNLKVEHNRTPGRSGILRSESKKSSPRKLTFRRGRVVELKPEINTPIRLKFRRVRLLGEVRNSKGSTKEGSTERKKVDASQSNGAGIKKGSIGRKEVGGGQSNGAGINKGRAGRREVDESQSNGAKINSGKILLRNQERDVEGSPRKSLRGKGVGVGVSDGAKSGPEKVVLRPQNVKDSDVQQLFNNVIEETASRLVVSRKGKVKALVGAFETVISLQDMRPSATADES